jgi:hypothetical protein
MASTTQHVDSDGHLSLGPEWANRRVRVTLVLQDEYTATRCAHLNTVTQPADETFLERRGCLDCNQWLDPVRLRKP